jgi:ferredoxin
MDVDDDLPCVNAALCMGCGLCVSKCPEGALSLHREVSKGTPLELKSLLENAEG